MALLTELDYLRGDEVTEHGKRLARLYGELDLLASECLRDGVWEGLSPAELAACVSALVYEARVGDDAVAPKLPSGKAKAALGEMVRIWGRLDALEEDFRINQTEGVGQREPDLGFAWAAYQWASGKGLDEVLREAEMPAGDFVRWCKQVIDVLGPDLGRGTGVSGARAARSRRTRARRSTGCCGEWWRTRRWGERVGGSGAVGGGLCGAGGWGSRGRFCPLRPYPSLSSGAPPQAPPGGAAPWTPARGCAPWTPAPQTPEGLIERR